jgi:hypothetical protein
MDAAPIPHATLDYDALVRVCRPTPWRPLHDAACGRHPRVLRKILALGAPGEVNATHAITGFTALHWAVHCGRNRNVLVLLKTPGVAVNPKDVNGWTPLHWAASNGRHAAVLALLSAPDVHVNAKSNDGRTPLHIAAGLGHVAVVRALLAAPGVDVSIRSINAKDGDCSTALSAAFRHGHLPVVLLLLLEQPCVRMPTDAAWAAEARAAASTADAVWAAAAAADAVAAAAAAAEDELDLSGVDEYYDRHHAAWTLDGSGLPPPKRAPLRSWGVALAASPA